MSQNVFLLVASLFFYAWGEPVFVLIMMSSIIINWAAGLFVSKFKSSGRMTAAKAALATAITFNLIIIFIFSYLSTYFSIKVSTKSIIISNIYI